jgi:beta-lactamase regulating signal transducer with metallopeptidase domain
MLCILYVNAVGALLGIAGRLTERALPASFARRWVWAIVIPISLFVPGYYRTHHAAAVGTTSLTATNDGFWARVESLDLTINRVWLVVSALLVVWMLLNAARVWNAVVASRMGRRGQSGPTVVDGVDVIVTDALGPATVGLLHSRVLLPRWVLALPSVQRRYVVRHEDEHRRAHDGRFLFLASLLLILVPWNLALWWQLRRLSLAIEMDCDNRVVRALGDAPAYGDLLLKIAEAGNRGPRLQPALLGVGELEQRLTELLAPATLRLSQRYTFALVVGALLLLVMTMPHPVVAKSHVHAVAMKQSNVAP